MIKYMKYYIAFLVIFLNSVFSFSQDATNLKSFILKSFGLNGISVKSNAEEIVKNKWQIKNDVITGCVVTEDLIKNVTIHNDSVKQQIAKINGVDWETKFNNEVIEEEKKLAEITDFLNKDPKVIRKKEKYKGEENRLQYHFSYDEKSTLYKVSLVFNDSKIKKLMEFDFDLNNKKYSIINS